MAEFGELRDRLQQVREQLQATASGLAGAREQLRRVEARQQELARVFDAGVPAQVAERERLEAERAARRSRVEAAGRRRRRGGQRANPRCAASSRSSRIPVPLPRS